MRTHACWALALLLAGAAAVTAAKKPFVQIKGSDTMVNLAQAWAEAYMKARGGEFVAVTGGGSGTGLKALSDGTCAIALSSRDISPKEIEAAKKKGVVPHEIKVALDGLAVVVHPGNSVTQLTMDQLADIFSGKIVNWKEVGGKDETIVLLSRETNSGTHMYFKEHVLHRNDPHNKTEFAPKALMLPSSQAIADEVAQNPSAIGYYGMGYISGKQKALRLAKAAGAEAVEPTIANVTAGHYPISRPLLLFTNGEPKDSVKAFIDFVLSPEGQAIVVQTDFVPVGAAPAAAAPAAPPLANP